MARHGPWSRWKCSLGFDIVVGRLDVNFLSIDDVALVVTVKSNDLDLGLLCEIGGLLHVLLLVSELHFDEAKSSAAASGPVAHDDGVSNNSELLEILNHVGF